MWRTLLWVSQLSQQQQPWQPCNATSHQQSIPETARKQKRGPLLTVPGDLVQECQSRSKARWKICEHREVSAETRWRRSRPHWACPPSSPSRVHTRVWDQSAKSNFRFNLRTIEPIELSSKQLNKEHYLGSRNQIFVAWMAIACLTRLQVICNATQPINKT